MATAYAALLSVLNDLEAIKNHPYHFFSFENKQIQSLGESVIFLIDFMESCDNSPGAHKEAARVLEGPIARAAHAAEDVIESHVVYQILSGSTLRGKKTPRFLMDLQKVIEDMEFVKRKAMKVVKLRSGHITELQPTNSPAATSSSTTSDRNTVVGFDDVLHQLLDQLTREASNLQITPITGMGGIGKTTLAKTAFEHPLIVQHFDVCCWATISQQYVVGDIISKLLDGHGNSNSATVHELGEQLHKRLYGRRYCIVLDDMWSPEIWDEIQFFFPDTSNRSRIVVTTRLTEVADYLGSPCFPMRFLDEKRSWDLFCQKAFAGQGCPGELEDAGKKVVKKCKGLPLAITVVGGHLGKSPRTQQHWENVAEHMMNTIFNSGENEQLVFDILSLSYSYLPVHLKPCFLYMGTIIEHDIVLKEDIIKTWIGEGFIKPNQTGESLETIAKGYLEDLIERNLVLLNVAFLRMPVPGKHNLCIMHDVVRELCLKISKKEQFFDFLDAPRAIQWEERRVVISEKIPKVYDYAIFAAQRSAPLIRSLTWVADFRTQIAGQLSYDLKLVRVLNAGSEKIRNMGMFPSTNLRYLECSSKCFHGYPSYIAEVFSFDFSWNLQTLILSYEAPVICLPYEIWDMVHLRHLEGLVHLPDPLYRDKSHQVNLQILRRVCDFKLIEEVCDKISRIKELWLIYESATSDFCPQNLGSFLELESLDCCIGRDTICHDFALSFTFPNSLKELGLTNTRLEWEELTMMVGSLPLLEVLHLGPNAVTGSEWTPVEGTFLNLTRLTIRCYHDLVYLNANCYHFPRLIYLFLVPSPEMNELPLEIGELPSLELLTVQGCNLSLAISALRILEYQEEQGNDCLKLQVSLIEDDDRIRFEEEVGEDGLKRKNLQLNSFAPFLLI